jgi:preprotein translocase subunit SecB
MKASKLDLVGYYFKELSFSVRSSAEKGLSLISFPGLNYTAEFKRESHEMLVNAKFRGGRNKEDPSRWRFELKLESAAPDTDEFPYDYSAHVVGYFEVNADHSLNEETIRTNSIALLYGIARDALAATTARGPFPGILLPSVSFIDSPLIQKPEVATKSKAVKGKSSKKTQAGKRSPKGASAPEKSKAK